MLKYLLSYRCRTLFLVCFTIVGLLTSRAVMSIGAIAFFANVLLDLNFKKTIKDFYNNKALFSISLLFFVSVISLSYSSDIKYGFTYVLNKVPFLVIPLAFSKMTKMTKGNFIFILNFFVLFFFSVSILVFYRYISNFEQANILLKQGQAIWVPFNHIRFSTMLVFAFISSIYLLLQKDFNKQVFKFNTTIFYSFLALFFFVLINILSVRSALIVLYLSLIISLLFYTIETKRYKILVFGLLLIVMTPILSYKYLDSFKNRIDYMKYDWHQFFNNKAIGSNSDSKRFISYKLGFQLVKKGFPLGLGTGDIHDEMHELYKKQYPDIGRQDRIMPHNEFLYILVDYGLLGFIALLFTVFYPLVSLKNKRKNLLYILFWVVVITPTLFDTSLEVQIGITFFTLFSSLILKHISNQEQYA